MTVMQAPQPTPVKEKRGRNRRKDHKSAEEWYRRSQIGLVQERRRSIRREEDRADEQFLSWYRDDSKGANEPRKIIFDRVSIMIRHQGQRKIIEFTGELSYADHAAIQNVLRKTVSDNHEEVILNMENLTSVDSAGLGVLVGAHISQARKGKPVTLVNVRQSVYRTIVNCGLQKMLPVSQRV